MAAAQNKSSRRTAERNLRGAGLHLMIKLRSTCTHSHRILDPINLVQDVVKRIQLEWLEDVPQHAGDKGYACFKCWKIKPRDAFAKKQIVGKRGKDHVDADCRFCLDCGLSKNIYTRGDTVRKMDGKLYYKCCLCPTFKDGLYCEYCRLCQDCLHLPVDFKGVGCRRCKQDRISGEPRERELERGYPTYVSTISSQFKVGLEDVLTPFVAADREATSTWRSASVCRWRNLRKTSVRWQARSGTRMIGGSKMSRRARHVKLNIIRKLPRCTNQNASS